MKALVLRNDAEAAAGDAQALIDKGFQVVCVETRKVAHALMRIETIDLLVMEERVEERLTHALALSAERRNPYISTILMTDRPGADTDDLYDLIPSLYALVGTRTAPRLLGQLALSSAENYDEIAARVQRYAAIDAAEEALGDDPIPDDAFDDEADHGDHASVLDVAPDDMGTAPPDFGDAAHGFSETDDSADDDMPLDEMLDIPSYADAVLATPALAEPAPAEEAILFGTDMQSEPATDHPEEVQEAEGRPAAHLAQVSVIGDMRAARAAFR